MLFADSEIVSPHLVPALIGSLIFVLVGTVLLVLGLPMAMRVVDRNTPGKLADQLVPTAHAAQPNVALAIVVGLMLLGMIHGVATIIAAAIH